jgi:hypothetical protein
VDQSLCKLTLVVPPDGFDRVVELLIAIEPPIGGFTTWSTEGHAHDFAGASTSERVRGRVRREMLVAILPRARAASVLELLRDRAAIAHMAYWIEPVEAFGRMEPAAQPFLQPHSSQPRAH